MIHIGVGGCGGRVAEAFFEGVTYEHTLSDHSGRETYFHQVDAQVEIPRLVLVDRTGADRTSLSKLIPSDRYIAGEYQLADWVEFDSGRSELTSSALEAVRR